MNTYKVKITETLEKFVEIQAENIDEALQIADNNYRAALNEYILDSGNFTDVVFNVEGTSK